MDNQAGRYEAFRKRTINNFDNRCLHHHVFNLECLEKMYNYMNIDIIKTAKVFNDYVILGRK